MGGGGNPPQGLAAIGAETGGAVDGDQAIRLLPLALQEQSLELAPRWSALADAEEGIDPDGWIPGFGGRFQLGDPQPEGLAQVAFSEGFAPLYGHQIRTAMPARCSSRATTRPSPPLWPGPTSTSAPCA